MVNGKKKRRRGCLPVFIITLLLASATGYIIFIAATQPDRLNLQFNKPAAPALAEVTDDEDEDVMNNPFAVFNFYIADRQEEYEAYQYKKTYLSDEEVVWHVNAGLNRTMFDDAVLITHPNPLLVNPYNHLQDFFTPLSLEAIDNEGRLATPETIDAFKRMQADAAQSGFDLQVQSAYRTITYQRELHANAGGDGAVARPAFSEHHTGRALDLRGPDGLLDINGSTPRGQWVKENAYQYGFIMRYTAETQHITGYIDEPWHITYVGEAIALEMTQGGYKSLEEYVAKYPDVALP